MARQHGTSQESVLNKLLDEHEMHEAHAAYARLRDDPAAWSDYQQELAEWDTTVGDGLSDARDEYPEYNQ